MANLWLSLEKILYQNKIQKKACGVFKVVECLHSLYRVLCTFPNTSKREDKTFPLKMAGISLSAHKINNKCSEVIY
jgi:hypothetical protein